MEAQYGIGSSSRYRVRVGSDAELQEANADGVEAAGSVEGFDVDAIGMYEEGFCVPTWQRRQCLVEVLEL